MSYNLQHRRPFSLKLTISLSLSLLAIISIGIEKFRSTKVKSLSTKLKALRDEKLFRICQRKKNECSSCWCQCELLTLRFFLGIFHLISQSTQQKSSNIDIYKINSDAQPNIQMIKNFNSTAFKITFYLRKKNQRNA